MYHGMKSIMRLGAAIVAVGVLTGVAAGCGSSSNSSAQSDKATLVISNSQWQDALRGKNLWNALKKFEKVHPDITIEQESIPSADYSTKITTQMGAGKGPDIVIAQDFLFYTLADAHFLEPIEGKVSSAKLNDSNKGGVIDGKRYGVAWQRAAYAMIYNKGLVDKAGVGVPKDLNELVAVTQAVRDKTGAVGFTARTELNDISGWTSDFQNWAFGYGVNWVDKKGKLTIDTPQAVKAFSAFKKLYDASVIPAGTDFPTQRSQFKQSNVGYSIDNSGGTLNIVSGGTLKPTELGSASLPFANPGAHQQLYISVNAKSKNKTAAAEFMDWLVTPDAQQALRDASGPDMLATDVPMSAQYTKDNPWAPTFAELAQHSRSTLIPGHETKTAEIMRPVMEALEKVLKSNASPDDALKAAQAEVDKSFK
jgi:multiple sugar transport system substrate-binding protein